MDTLLILTLVIGIIWFVPIVCRKIHVPSIVGFILAGIVIGPSVLNLVAENSTVKILGSLGMLYIMFQSGSEMDINDFKQYKYRSLFFGLCTFFIPFALGLITSRYLLPYGWWPSGGNDRQYCRMTAAQAVAACPSQEKTVTSSRSNQTVTPDSGKLLSKVTVSGLAPTGTYTASSRGASLDMGATSNYRYVNTNSVPNSNSGTKTISSSDTNWYTGNVDMGATNTYRYVNAVAVYNKGVSDGGTSVGAKTVTHVDYQYIVATGVINKSGSITLSKKGCVLADISSNDSSLGTLTFSVGGYTYTFSAWNNSRICAFCLNSGTYTYTLKSTGSLRSGYMCSCTVGYYTF